MITPHAILIGLSLTAAAIYFKDTATNLNFVKDAHAATSMAYFSCFLELMEDAHSDRSASVLSNFCKNR